MIENIVQVNGLSVEVQNTAEILKDIEVLLQQQKILKRGIIENKNSLQLLKSDLEGNLLKLDIFERASNLIGTVSEKRTKDTLDFISGVINKTLHIVFSEDKREISIKKEMYRKIYPHLKVVLTTKEGDVQSFKQNGMGLAQIVSFLFTILLIDARKSRKIFVMDELLSGLHPSAKKVIAQLITLLAKEGFQFVIMEYFLDTPNQYEFYKKGDTCHITPYVGESYYEESSWLDDKQEVAL